MARMQLERRMSRLIQKWSDEISDPLSDPERVGELLYRIREHDARMESVRASRIQNISSGVRKRDTQSRDFGYYLALAKQRNTPIDTSFRKALDESLGIGRKSFHYVPSALIEEGQRQMAAVDEYRNMLAERSSEVITPLTTTPRRIGDPSSQARYYRQQEQFQRVMRGDYRQPLRTGDDDDLQYALGADTGVSNDFDYLRKRERRERTERVRQYLKTKRARAKGAKKIAQHQAEINYQRNLLRMTPRERERHELIMQYGGGPEGAALADEALQRRQDERIEAARRHIARQKSEGRYAYNLDQMTDYQRERHELVKKYGSGTEGQAMADAEMDRRAERRHREAEARGSIRNRRERLMLMKEFPIFFRNSRMSTRDMRQMAKSLKAIEKTPLVGRLLKMNPIAAASMMAIGITRGVSEFLEREDTANKRVVGLKNLEMLYGSIPGDIALAAQASGMSLEDIAKAFGKSNIKFGGQAEEIYRAYAEAAKDAPAFMRGIIAESFGLSEQEAVVAIRMHEKIGRSESKVAGKEIIDTALTAAASSEAPWYVRLGAWLIDNPLSFGLTKKALGRSVGSSIEGTVLENVLDAVQSASDAAESGLMIDTTQYGGAGARPPATSQSISFSINGPVNVTANDAGEFVGSIVDESKSRGGSEILEIIDTKEK